MLRTLVLAEQDHGSLSGDTARTLTAATQIGSTVDILVAGKNAVSAAKQAAHLSGVSCVLFAEDDIHDYSLAEPFADLILLLARDYHTIISGAASNGINALIRVAALLDVVQVSEVIEVLSPYTYKRLIHADNVLQTVFAIDFKRIVTVRANSFAPSPTLNTSVPCKRVTLTARSDACSLAEETGAK